MRVSVLGFGAAEIGFEEADSKHSERAAAGSARCRSQCHRYGECYRNSEEMIGRAISDRRNDCYLFTKCGHPHGVESGANWSQDSTPGKYATQFAATCKPIISISCICIVVTRTVLRKGEAIDALQTARDRGYTRYIGYSGDGHAAQYAAECGAFDSLQTSINIADQEAIEMVLPPHQEREMGVIAKRPVANVAWKTNHKPAQRLPSRVLGTVAET